MSGLRQAAVSGTTLAVERWVGLFNGEIQSASPVCVIRVESSAEHHLFQPERKLPLAPGTPGGWEWGISAGFPRSAGILLGSTLCP